MSMLNRAEMFNRRAASNKSMANEIIKNIKIKRGDVIVDIGSGGGYYSMRFAAETGLNGKVYALDVNEQFLDYVNQKATENGFMNISTILINDKVYGLPKKSCDLVFLRNVYHHINNPETYFKDLKGFLKPGGRIVIIDYKKTEGFNFINLLRHHVEEESIITCLTKSGYKHERRINFLPQQSFNIFKNI